MPANYLDDEEDLLPLPEEDEDQLPQAKLPAQAVSPSVRQILDRPQMAQGDPYEVADRKAKLEALTQAIKSKPDAPQPKWYQRLAAAAMGAGAGWVNAAGRTRPIDIQSATRGIMAPGYDRKLDEWRNRVTGAQAASEAANANEQSWLKNWQMKNTDALNAAQIGHMNAQTAALPGQAVTSAIEHGGEVLADGQGNPDGREGSVQDIGGKKVFFPSKKQAEKDKKLADQETWPEVTPEMADALSDVGVAAGMKVPKEVFNQYQRIISAKQKEPKLVHREFTNENSGDVTIVGFDPITMEEKSRQVVKGVAVKRPPVNNFMNTDQGKQAMEEVAQSLARGDLSRLRDITGMRGDQRLQIYARAKQINPNFSTGELDRKLKMEDYYANGKGANNLQSFGTFLEHAGTASDAVNTIRNTQSPAINKPINWWRRNMAGDPAFQAFSVSLEPVRKEFEGFLLGGRALYGDDRKNAEIILNENSSPAAIQAALKAMGHTAVARFNEENFRYKKVMGRDLVDPLSPEAIAGAQRIGVPIGGKGGSATVHFNDNGVDYDIPADKVQAFQSAHPNAKRGGQ